MLTEGMFIAERYEIIGKIGAGGMSDVYKAKDHVLGRFVAIKVLKQEFSEDVNFVTKFRTEAQSAAGLEHPNIVNIYDVGSENGMHYIVMEYVDGITLKTYIEKKGKLTYKEAVSIAIQVGRGIEAAHNKNIVHRDIKPQNIIISTEGKVKVTDFGIARAATSNTINSDVMGSVHYSSPEQARNGFVDGKSDIYSLGITMYEMVTGRVPFDGDTTVAVAIQHLQEEMVPPTAYTPDLPISLEKIILKCTQKNPDRRYENMGELLIDLKKCLISPNEDFVTMVPLGSNDKIEMIDLRGLTFEEAQNEIKDKKLDIKLEEGEEISSDDYEEGQIAEQSVKKGESVKAGDTVTVRISSGAGDVPIPDVAGYKSSEAQKKLEDMGFKVSTDYDYSDTVQQDYVIKTTPDIGTNAKKGDTITLILSRGIESVQVPDVRGKSESDAKNELTGAGLNVTTKTDYSDDVAEGLVISQDPVNGKFVDRGTTVTLTISLGKKTTYYSYKSDTLAVPQDGKNYTGGTVTLKGSDGSTLWTTTFEGTTPGSVNVDNIKNMSSGTLEVDWTYTNEDGTTGTNVVSTSVNFTEK